MDCNDSDKEQRSILNLDKWKPTKTTEAYNTFWKFATERQAIFFRRINKRKGPWTDDEVLGEYKFTNAYRASDRVSQYLIRKVIYEGLQDPEEIFFRIILFKTFNKIETWEYLRKELGQIVWNEFDFRRYDMLLTKARNKNVSIYSGAYIMPSGGSFFGHKAKHRNHLRLIERMMFENVSLKIQSSPSLQSVFNLLRSYPMIGDFLAYQYAIDINYSTLINFSEMSFVVPGPGAKDGIKKCFSDNGGLSDVDIIKRMADIQEHEFNRFGLNFQSLWGRKLQLIDIQNLFCEVDKYSRIIHPNIKGLSGRSRIKQKFRPNLSKIDYFYPPKWEVNDAIRKTVKSTEPVL